MSHQSPVVLIAGPTASGKSALAMELAEKLGGVVVNADSMQVYRDLRVITARPSAAEEVRVPHRLYGHADAAENYSVGRWCRDVAGVIADVHKHGRVPILVGGTGLYFTALTAGLSAVPPISPDIRAEIRRRMKSEGVNALHAELAKLDAQTAHRVMPKDASRIGRALEVAIGTGRALSDWHREGMPPVIDPARAAKVFLTHEREALVARIEARFEAMLSAGALEEVRALAARNLDPMLPVMRAHGVPWLIRHLNGELTLAQAAEGGKMDTRRYGKRQHTWFRNQLPDWPWATAADAGKTLEIQWAAV